MSEKRDLERDLAVAHLLEGMPAPDVPADLAARIVANVSRLPQQSTAPEPEVAEAPDAAEASAVGASPEPGRVRANRRRWLPLAIGGAIAASAAGVLLMQPHQAPERPVVVAQVTPVAPPRAEVRIAIDELRLNKLREDAAPKTTPKRARKAPADVARQAPQPQPVVDPAPEMAVQVQPAPTVQPSEAPVQQAPVQQAIVGPMNEGGVVGPVLQGPPSTGLGIVGSGPVSPPGSPVPRGPRF